MKLQVLFQKKKKVMPSFAQIMQGHHTITQQPTQICINGIDFIDKQFCTNEDMFISFGYRGPPEPPAPISSFKL